MLCCNIGLKKLPAKRLLTNINVDTISPPIIFISVHSHWSVKLGLISCGNQPRKRREVLDCSLHVFNPKKIVIVFFGEPDSKVFVFLVTYECIVPQWELEIGKKVKLCCLILNKCTMEQTLHFRVTALQQWNH